MKVNTVIHQLLALRKSDKVRNAFIVFVLVFVGEPTLAQSASVIDSLNTELKNRPDRDTARISVLYHLARAYKNVDIHKTIEYTDEMEVLADSINFEPGIAKALFLKAIAAVEQSAFDKSIAYLDSAGELFEKLGNQKYLIKCKEYLGITLSRKGLHKEAEACFVEVLQAHRTLRNHKHIPVAIRNLAGAKFSLGKKDEALADYHRALDLCKAQNDIEGQGICYNNIGAWYQESGGSLVIALEFFFKAHTFYELSNNLHAKSILDNNIGSVYSKRGENEKALIYFRKSLEYLESRGNKMAVSNVKMNMGRAYQTLERYDTARIFFNEALDLAVAVEHTLLKVFCLNNLGSVHMDIDQHELALVYFKKALSLNENIGHPLSYALSHFGLAKCFLNTGCLNDASVHAHQAEKFAQKANMLKVISMVAELLSQIYNRKGDFEKAYQKSIDFKTYSDSLFNEENVREIAQLESEYKYKQALDSATIREISLNSQIETADKNLALFQKRTLAAVTGFLALTLVLGIVIFLLRIRNIQSANENALMEQKLLRSQMTPHFMFNSLAILQGIILNKEFKKAIIYLSKFSRLLRLMLENSRDKTVSLENEIKAVENYLMVQNLGVDLPYHYEISVDQGIDQEHIEIPPMMIQPFVENAIEHAFKKEDENKEITVKMSMDDEQLVCIIMDNGIGIEARRDKKELADKKSLATTITAERLKMMSQEFGMPSGVEIKDRKYTNEKGTIVTIVLPFKQQVA